MIAIGTHIGYSRIDPLIMDGILEYADQHPSSHCREVIIFPWRENSGSLLQQLPIRGIITQIWDYRESSCVIASGLPAVIVAHPSPGRLASINVDDVAVGRAAANYFLQRGYRHFGFAPYFRAAEFSEQRLMGFVSTLHTAGYGASIFGGHPGMATLPPGATREGVEMTAWLQSLPKPMALLACTDTVAQLVDDAARVARLAIPGQIALLGINNEVSFYHSAGGISSIELPFRKIGYRAAEVLDNLIRGIPPDPLVERLPPVEIVTRASSDAHALNDADVADAVRFIREKYSEGIDVQDVLNKISLGRRTLERRFRIALGITPKQEIQRVRVLNAKLLLAQTSLAISEIAGAVGFPNRSKFFTTFKSATGLSPAGYRGSLHHLRTPKRKGGGGRVL